ncbi:MAG: hypothetical protein HY822_20640 [Acidobacteria bacterium]|nr:hypothetical protein [Acidobacteriota bacterium]
MVKTGDSTLKHRFPIWVRDLHLYLGLFLSPFVLLFALSAVFLNHGWRPGPEQPVPVRRALAGLEIPPGIEASSGIERIRLLRPLLERAGVTGEVGPINYRRSQSRMTVPVTQAGRAVTVEIDLAHRTGTVVERTTGVWDGLVYLHKMPGQHLVSIRKNWLATRLWSWSADATVYLLLFVTASGVYLWLAVRSRRRAGLLLLAAGVLTFGATVYALCR